MRWKGRRKSTNVQDRRGQSGRRGPVRMPGGGRGGKVGGGFAIIAIIVALLLGVDPTQLLNLVGEPGAVMPQAPTERSAPVAGDEEAERASVVLASTEDAWGRIFQEAGGRYRAPDMVLFTDGVESACGYTSSATGPFYCPGDSQVYLDLGFFRELARMGGSGDFATAYVIAHEVGHHIQNLTGVHDQVRQMRGRMSQTQSNALSVRVELQADCYAGVWAHYAARDGDFLEQGDLEEGLRAAAAIGDDRLQRMAGRRVQPESFTHGSSEQRQEWFTRGLRSGDYQTCDTFN
ncbi:MAG: flagellar biosynthesis protein FlgM [Rhodothermales bacterium]|nr:flagellar biosynthesis protein FlgM [Rhodothermales bacterium]